MENENKKPVSKLSKILRFSVFVICFCGLYMLFNSIFSTPSTHMTKRFNTFYALPENTLDAVYIGSSAVDRYYIPTEGWKQEGITVYPLSSNVQPIVAAKYLIEEARKTQDPSVFIVETRGCKKETSTDTEGVYRSLTDQMNFSVTRIKLINALLDFNDISVFERPRYWFSLTAYHNTWEDGFGPEDFEKEYAQYMGFYVSNESTALITPFDEPVYTDVRSPLEDGVEEALRDLIAYAKEEKINLLFVSSPYAMTQLERERLNTVSDIIESEGIPHLNFNAPEENSIAGEMPVFDYSHDFYNEWHVNIYGAEKYTSYLAAELKEMYGLTDRRGQKDGAGYEQWDEAAELLNNKVTSLKKKNEKKKK